MTSRLPYSEASALYPAGETSEIKKAIRARSCCIARMRTRVPPHRMRLPQREKVNRSPVALVSRLTDSVKCRPLELGANHGG